MTNEQQLNADVLKLVDIFNQAQAFADEAVARHGLDAFSNAYKREMYRRGGEDAVLTYQKGFDAAVESASRDAEPPTDLSGIENPSG